MKNALDYLGAESDIFDHTKSILKADKIILPGVGSFPDCMKNLKESGFINALNQKVLIETTRWWKLVSPESDKHSVLRLTAR